MYITKRIFIDLSNVFRVFRYPTPIQSVERNSTSTLLKFSDIVLEKNVTRNSAKFAIFIEEKTQKVFFN